VEPFGHGLEVDGATSLFLRGMVLTEGSFLSISDFMPLSVELSFIFGHRKGSHMDEDSPKLMLFT
jgi:hypothetical protein